MVKRHLVVLGMILLIWGCVNNNQAELTVKANVKNEVSGKVDTVSGVRGLADEYMQSHQQSSQWWLRNRDLQNTEKMYIDSNDLRNKIKTTLNKYSLLSPETEKMAISFSEFDVSLYTEGSSMIIAKSNDSRNPFSDTNDKRLEVCFISEEQISQHPGYLYYKNDWPALMIAGVNYPSAVFDSLLLHELLHAFYHQVEQRPFSVQPPTSDLYVEEEIAAHRLEANVLNVATDGQYYVVIDKIVAKIKPIKFLHEVYENVSVEDLNKLDKAVGCDNCGADIAGTLFAEHFLVIGMRYLEAQNADPKYFIDLYKYMAAAF